MNWAILGTGAIAHRFAADFIHVTDARLLAVGSRQEERAARFGAAFNIPRRYGSYEEAVNDRDVDVVYIATPASLHRANLELCLQAKKAVLCEKPLTVSAREAEDVIALAGRHRTFVMEAMWTRFVPAVVHLRELLTERTIGEIRCFMADLGTHVNFDPGSRVFSAELGGGALLQKGVYLLSLASMLFGCPVGVKALSVPSRSGVDEDTGVLLGYSGGRSALLWCSVGARSGRRGMIVGTQGQILIHEPILCPSSLTIRRYGPPDRRQVSATRDANSHVETRWLGLAKRSKLIRSLRERWPMLSDRLLYGIRSSTLCLSPVGEGLHYQVSEVNRCVREGKLESDAMPLGESLSVMHTVRRIMKEIRRSEEPERS
ncbi:MAG TPA: Gfo/Idh/MocA family oxidoreductase [Nitrospira sp.]|nr:Gfo/Idh/MocA family oxidoreductase [Nitrospira sp.]